MSRILKMCAASILLLGIPRGGAAQPALATSPDVVSPGRTVSVTVTGEPGQHYAVIGSSTNAGFAYAGVALAVGPDLVILAQGMLDGSGAATAQVIPPFRGTTLDRYYLQAVTSSNATFVPLEASAGRVLRNLDAATGIVEARVARGHAAIPTLTMNFVSPTASVTVRGPGQRVHVLASRAFGSTVASGGIALTIHACVRSTVTGSAFVLDDPTGIVGIRVAGGTRVLNTVSHIFDGLPPGTYEAGMCGYIYDASRVGTWNDNGRGYATAFVFQ